MNLLGYFTRNRRILLIAGLTVLALGRARSESLAASSNAAELPKILVAPDSRGFQTSEGVPFVPRGVTYYRPGTGWAPQVWKKFDAEATRADFARMKEMGINCVRVFLSFGSFLAEPGSVNVEGLAKFDQFLAIAEAAGIYIHPTGPDHWEGTPDWAKNDRMANETVLAALETFWRQFAARYRGRQVLFAYDLLNEPEVGWDTSWLRQKWNRWALEKHGSLPALTAAWNIASRSFSADQIPIPEPKDDPGGRQLLDYQLFREEIADQWTQRQVTAIKAADPDALVTVGLIQWSVPVLLAHPRHYSAFRPQRQARWLDFMEVHFYPLNHGFYEYASAEDEDRNLAYLESVVAEVARTGKPVVIAEFGWYGGGKLTTDQGKHPAATEEQQARWCQRLIETSDGLAAGWLNWGFYDQPEAGDVSQLTGLLTADGRLKAWGQAFQRRTWDAPVNRSDRGRTWARPSLNWDSLLTSAAAGNQFREEYYRAFRKDR
ncbi:MAG: cellulase family glycosylhydrolase [Verrucomicrobiota bacterium]